MSPLTKLKQLVGKPHLYKQEPLTITDYEMDTEAIYLQVKRNGKSTELMVSNTDTKKFFEDLLPIDQSSSLQSDRQEISIYQSQQKSLGELRTQLMQLNTKLSGDDGNKYIQQAKAINNNINTLINSLKLELMVAKEIKKNQ